ncbi:YaiI/YqxD family protein [Hoeflea sp.]|uniref:YaiI/YqxD family protein n=1 Tax=Hoeflea sp. TaxID=1940281 RepID=UPI003B01624E
MNKHPTIFVDADACPVKDEVLKVAGRHEAPVTFVANGGLRPSRDPMIRNIIVSAGFDAADDWIAENAGETDIVITADILLARRCVETGAGVLSPTGRLFDDTSIGMATAMRNLNQDLREAGEIKGRNAPFSQRDRSRFLEMLDRLVRQKMRERQP